MLNQWSSGHDPTPTPTPTPTLTPTPTPSRPRLSPPSSLPLVPLKGASDGALRIASESAPERAAQSGAKGELGRERSKKSLSRVKGLGLLGPRAISPKDGVRYSRPPMPFFMRTRVTQKQRAKIGMRFAMENVVLAVAASALLAA